MPFPLRSYNLADPLDVANFLFLEFQETVEDTKVELTVETVHLHLYLLFKDHVFECVFAYSSTELFEHCTRVRHILKHFFLHWHVFYHLSKLVLSLTLEKC